MITTRTRFASLGGIALISIATLFLVPWKLTAQDADAEAVAKLKEENAKLRQELEAVRRDTERMRADAEQLRKRAVEEREEMRKRAVAEHENDSLSERRLAEDRRFARDAQEFDRRQRAVEMEKMRADYLRLQADLDQLRTKFSNDHPEVRNREVALVEMEARIAASQIDPELSLKPSPRTKMASVPATERALKRHEQQRALLQKEIELAERHVEYVRKALESGKENFASLLAAQRELLDAKLQLARLSNSKADQRAVLLQQLNVAEDMLKECKKRVEVGTLSSGVEIPFEREVLRIRRQLASPELEN